MAGTEGAGTVLSCNGLQGIVMSIDSIYDDGISDHMKRQRVMVNNLLMMVAELRDIIENDLARMKKDIQSIKSWINESRGSWGYQ